MEDTKWVTRSYKSTHNIMAKGKRTKRQTMKYNSLHKKLKYWPTQIPMKPVGELRCSGKVSCFFTRLVCMITVKWLFNESRRQINASAYLIDFSFYNECIQQVPKILQTNLFYKPGLSDDCSMNVGVKLIVSLIHIFLRVWKIDIYFIITHSCIIINHFIYNDIVIMTWFKYITGRLLGVR